MLPSTLPNRRRIAAAFLAAILVLFFIAQHDSITTSLAFKYYTRPQFDLFSQQVEFWKLLRADLENNSPGIPPVTHPEGVDVTTGFDPSNHKARPDFLKMYTGQWETMGKAHTAFVQQIRSREYQLPYEANTRGIVTTAGGQYMPVALVSIRMIRETGSQLPVEVFLSDQSEWDPVICDELFPALNAKCVVLQDILDGDNNPQTTVLHKYQFKVMAMLFTSFEEALFLDSDCFPIHNPDHFFESEPFKSTGFVIWPDFWFASESRYYFEIADIPEPQLDEHPATESGEILFSKPRHGLSLLLAAYYNYYGPDYYYPLQSQGAPGEGDKETFVWSAVAIGVPYYKVETKVKALGYMTKAGDWRGSAMVQFDPVQDFDLRNDGEQVTEKQNGTLPRPFFMHVNCPKLDPAQIFDRESFGWTNPTTDSDGELRRIWHKDDREAIQFFGFDLEVKVWSLVKELACQYESIISSWKTKEDVCSKATQYWDTVFGSLVPENTTQYRGNATDGRQPV